MSQILIYSQLERVNLKLKGDCQTELSKYLTQVDNI